MDYLELERLVEEYQEQLRQQLILMGITVDG